MCFNSLIIGKTLPCTNRELGAGVEAAHAAAMGGPAIKNGGGGGVYPASSGAHEEHYAEGTKRERDKDERNERGERERDEGKGRSTLPKVKNHEEDFTVNLENTSHPESMMR